MNKRYERKILRLALDNDNYLDNKAKTYLIILGVLGWLAFIVVFVVYSFVLDDEINITRAYFLSMLLGIAIAYSAQIRGQIKQAQVLREYVNFDKDKIEKRLDEINS